MSRYFGDHRVDDGLRRQSLRSGAISTAARGINALVQIGSVLFLARLLTPEDYGLVAMVTALTGFAPVFVDLGTRDAVVQRLRITEQEVSALFWMTTAVGLLCTLLIAASGPGIAKFYGEPRLSGIVVISSLTFVAAALCAQHQALLRRAVMFRELAIVDTTANILSAIGAITMASFGLGYWALVTRPVAMFSITAAGVWLYCRWLPRRPVFTSSVKEMTKFGLNLSGFSLTDFVGKNSDRAIVGRQLGARTLGYYQNGLFIYDNLLDVLVFPLHQVAVASLSKLQGNLQELRRSWAKALSSVAFFAMPVFGILAVTAADVVVIVLGRKWAPAGALLSVLALRGIPHCVERTLGWLHVAAGRTDRWFRWGIFATLIQLVALACGIPFGVYGIVWAYVITMYVMFLPAIAFAGRPLQISLRDVTETVYPQLVAALVATAVGFGLRFRILLAVAPVERTAVLVSAYIVVYLAVTVGVFGLTEPIRIAYSLVSGFLPKRQIRSTEHSTPLTATSCAAPTRIESHTTADALAEK